MILIENKIKNSFQKDLVVSIFLKCNQISELNTSSYYNSRCTSKLEGKTVLITEAYSGKKINSKLNAADF